MEVRPEPGQGVGHHPGRQSLCKQPRRRLARLLAFRNQSLALSQHLLSPSQTVCETLFLNDNSRSPFLFMSSAHSSRTLWHCCGGLGPLRGSVGMPRPKAGGNPHPGHESLIR